MGVDVKLGWLPEPLPPGDNTLNITTNTFILAFIFILIHSFHYALLLNDLALWANISSDLHLFLQEDYLRDKWEMIISDNWGRIISDK